MSRNATPCTAAGWSRDRGRHVLVVGHHPSDLKTPAHLRTHRPEPDVHPDEIVSLLGGQGWEVVVAESRPRSVTDGEGHEVAVEDAVLAARRLGAAPQPVRWSKSPRTHAT